jgi:predicted ATP-dependent endonuclease of OLD family
VSDARRPEKVELEDRSTGLQWFLSFYLIFLVESSQDHRDAILLLDEPGLSLHPLAQRDLSAFFENLSDTNQIIYTTHSPFLVDADMLDRARKVYVSDDGSTKATSDLRRGSEDPRKSGATYAIYSALNMNVAESMLIGCHPVIVEGPSDQHYLTAIKTILIAAGKIKPARELIFPPAHGARNAQVIATILSGRDDVLPVMLLDGDDAGLKMAADMRNGLYKNDKTRVFDTKRCGKLRLKNVAQRCRARRWGALGNLAF